MKRSVLPALIAAVVSLSFAFAAKEFTYVGASTCKLCHKAKLQGGQYVIWDESLHSRAFANLSTARADEIAKAAGAADPVKNPQCLGCHAPLAAKAPELTNEGVTCEVCHGPGSGYKKLSIMEDRAKAVQNGLILYDGDPAAIQAHCLKCHQNPHGNPFDFEAAWGKIKHPLPAK
jgi:hypothetical protein